MHDTTLLHYGRSNFINHLRGDVAVAVTVEVTGIGDTVDEAVMVEVTVEVNGVDDSDDEAMTVEVEGVDGTVDEAVRVEVTVEVEGVEDSLIVDVTVLVMVETVLLVAETVLVIVLVPIADVVLVPTADVVLVPTAGGQTVTVLVVAEGPAEHRVSDGAGAGTQTALGHPSLLNDSLQTEPLVQLSRYSSGQ